MKLEDLGELEGSFERFTGRFGRFFHRSESREVATKYVQGLLSPVKRKNGWQLSEAVGEEVPDAIQRLLYRTLWDENAVRDELQRYGVEEMSDPEGIVVIDETGFLKCGEMSVGVQRQYSGTAGKVENCQLGVFLSYSSPKGWALLDRRLYLPKVWTEDEKRRKKAQVPKEVTFKTKPELALERVRHAAKQRLSIRWVTGDEVYGDNPGLRHGLEKDKTSYVLAVSKTLPAYSERPRVEVPEQVPNRKGRKPTRERVAADGPQATTAEAIAASQEASIWRRLVVGAGEKGPREYDWLAVRIVERDKKLPRADLWLLARRSVADPSELAYYLSNAPESTSLEELANVAAQRYIVEQCFREAKQEVGLDEYEVRLWPSWHRHITLSMMALAWLNVTRRQVQEKGGPTSPTWRPSPSRRSDASSPSPSKRLSPHGNSPSSGRTTVG